MASFEGGSTNNFDSATGGQTNEFWVPEIYSKKVQIAFRKASITEAITNSDYFGEISGYGDTVNIIKEPTITVYDYTRGLDTTLSNLSDQELVLTVDQAKAFKFIVDDLEKRFSHVNWQSLAADQAAYQLKDAMDTDVLAAIAAAASVNTYGSTAAPIDTGFTTGELDPLDVMARMARLLDDQNVPEENRWFAAPPKFYEELAKTSSKLMSVDYNQGDGGLRNGLVASGQLRGFKMYKSNNMPSWIGTGSFSGTSDKFCIAGHMSAVASAQALTSVESFRDPTSFGDVVRGLSVWGRKVLRPEAVVLGYVLID